MSAPVSLFRLVWLGLSLVALLAVNHGRAEPFALVSPSGVRLEFSEGATGWRWTRLWAPGSPDGGWSVEEEGVEVATADATATLNRGWVQTDRDAGRVVLEQESPATGLRLRRIFSFGPASNVVRLETWVQSPDVPALLARVGLLDVRVDGERFRTTGEAPASFPVLGERLFAGIEHVSGEAAVEGEHAERMLFVRRPRLTADTTWRLAGTVVVGWVEPERGFGVTADVRIREAFLHYLDSVRLKPDRVVLHTDTWWTVPLPLTEKRVLDDIAGLKRAFFDRTGMFFDTYCVDLGWSDPHTVWGMDSSRFPNDLRPIRERLGELGAKMGLWLSPGSGYPDGLDNGTLAAQGYEMQPFGRDLGQVPCFALGTRYQREVRTRLMDYARQYDLGHVILDFMPQRCDEPNHGHPVGAESRYAIDAGLADVLDGLRAVNPTMALEPMVCGYPPSPWWLMKTPFVLGPAGDDLPYGRGPATNWLESLITARDIAYRAGQEAWIMPTQALETFDITVLSPGEFQNMAAMAVGRGRWFLSTYFNTDLMRPEDWDFLAALVRWARQNKDYLVNAWQFGGRPEQREAYGFMFRHAARDIFCVRNPWIEERVIELPGSPSATEARDVRMIYPRRAGAGRMEPGQRGLTVTLAPYETAFFETVPAGDAPSAAPVPADIDLAFVGTEPRVDRIAAADGRSTSLRYRWEGQLVAPDILEGELLVLVEGEPGVERAEARIVVNGREVKARKVTSADQFGAAVDISPENWTWFVVPTTAGPMNVQVDVATTLADASVGVFLRGALRATSDPVPAGAVAFPTFRSDRRGWSKALRPLAAFPALDGER